MDSSQLFSLSLNMRPEECAGLHPSVVPGPCLFLRSWVSGSCLSSMMLGSLWAQRLIWVMFER